MSEFLRCGHTFDCALGNKLLRNKRIDILRAIAVLLVLGRHGEDAGPFFWYPVGWAGVDLFFVLSGFLISGLLFSEHKKTGGINWKRFFLRRGLKIYPAFYAMIFCTFLWNIALYGRNVWKTYLPEIFFYQSYQSVRLWEHTWSLAVEEHFYLLLPAFLLVLLWVRPKEVTGNPFAVIPAAWAALATICLLLRTYLAYTLPADTKWLDRIVFPTHLRIDALFFGVLLGYLYHYRGEGLKRAMAQKWIRTLLCIASALLLSTCVAFPLESRPMLTFGLTCVYVGFGAILLLVLFDNGESTAKLSPRLQKLAPSNVAAFIGKHSYSIYLWHLLVKHSLLRLLAVLRFVPAARITFWVYIAATITVGVFLSLVLEFPVLRIRDRYFPSAALGSPEEKISNPAADLVSEPVS